GGLVPFALFLLVVVATRSMAFRLFSEAVVSLDSAFYIAAVLCLGSVATGWLVAVALTVDAVLRLVRRETGTTPKRDVRRWAGTVAEATLVPLAVVIVLIYNPNDLLAFILLGTTYLLINFVFSRLSDTGAKLRQRVIELETLNRTAHVLAHSLQLHQLVESIS